MHVRTHAFSFFAVYVVTVFAGLALLVAMRRTSDTTFRHTIGTLAHLHCTIATRA